MKRTIIVDKNDNEIGVKDDKDMTTDDIYRVTGLWLINSQGQVLLVRRALTKSHDPGKWAPTVAGTVEESETYDINIVKEIKEEIGLDVKIEDLIKGPKVISSYHWTHYTQAYLYLLPVGMEKSLVFDASEVCDHKWYYLDEIQGMVEKNPEIFVGSFKRNFRSRSEWISGLIEKLCPQKK